MDCNSKLRTLCEQGRTSEIFPKLRLGTQAEEWAGGSPGALFQASHIPFSPSHSHPLRITFSLLVPFLPPSMARSERMALGLVRV